MSAGMCGEDSQMQPGMCVARGCETGRNARAPACQQGSVLPSRAVYTAQQGSAPTARVWVNVVCCGENCVWVSGSGGRVCGKK
jgi:hypothetical protein